MSGFWFRAPRILAWEDGFCNFAATTTAAACGQEGAGAAAAAAYADCEAAAAAAQEAKQGLGLQPELFFKMSHDIYNYGEGSVLLLLLLLPKINWLMIRFGG